jgi:ADP-heptose:LPS heptosyltransferase
VTVLVLRALGLGDFLTAVPALRAVRRAFPDARVMLAAPPAVSPLAELSGAVDEVVPAEPLGAVAVKAPDVAVNLHGRGPQSHRVLLATSPRRIVAFRHPEVPESAGMPEWRPDEHEVDRWCRLVNACGMPAIRTQLRLPIPTVDAPAAAAGAAPTHPGAASAARRWPAERWVEVARAEVAQGGRVAISAGPGERELAESIAAAAGLGPEVIVAGDLLELAAAVAAARVLACGDTGVAHMATAFGTPSVVLFGPTSPALWGPPGWHPHVALWTGRRGDPHGSEPDPGLLEISPRRVVAAMRSLGGGRLN